MERSSGVVDRLYALACVFYSWSFPEVIFHKYYRLSHDWPGRFHPRVPGDGNVCAIGDSISFGISYHSIRSNAVVGRYEDPGAVSMHDGF